MPRAPWVAREFGLARKTVEKMLEYSLPPGYRRRQPVRRPKLGPWLGVIDAIVEEGRQRPRKQRHTAWRIFERLRAEHGYRGGYTIVKDYVRGAKLSRQEMFVPLAHAPGEAQADFGAAEVAIAGVEQTAFDLPHSDDGYVQVFLPTPVSIPKAIAASGPVSLIRRAAPASDLPRERVALARSMRPRR